MLAPILPSPIIPSCILLSFLFPSLCLTCLLKVFTLGGDHRHEFVPGFDKRSGPFVLQFCCQGADVDSGLGKLVQHRFAVTAIGRHDQADFAVIGKAFQGALRHCVNRERGGQLLDVKDVGSLGIFGSRAGKQESLWAGAALKIRFQRGEAIRSQYAQ